MSEVLGTFEVLNHTQGQRRLISLLAGLDDSQLAFIAAEWQPLLDASRERAVLAFYALPPAQQDEPAWQDKQQRFGGPDSHWDWAEKRHSMNGASQHLYALVDDTSVEAVMRIDLSKGSRVNTGTYDPIVYIEYLAIAPWNRATIQMPPRFKGLGKLMVGVAAAVSQAEGMAGRCGLHSLQQSEGFYRRLGMSDLGPDVAAEGLHYFELSMTAAATLLEEV